MQSNSFPDLSNYSFKSQAGKGGFGTVWLAEHNKTKLQVAIKVFRNEVINQNQESQLQFMRSIEISKKAIHPFLVHLYELVVCQENTYLIMEYVENRSLLDFMNFNISIIENKARRFFNQVIIALEYLHNVLKVAHRDIKAENILLDRYNNIRIIDFGLSREFVDSSTLFITKCGTPNYAAPEVLKGDPYNKKSDIWSAGVLLYYMVAGKLPFDDPDPKRIYYNVINKEPQYSSNFTIQLVDILKKLLQKDPNKRITLDKIKTHQWFSQTEYNVYTSIPIDKEPGKNREIIEKIGSYGYSIKDLTSSLLYDHRDELTTLYYILEDNKRCDTIQEYINSHDSDFFGMLKKNNTSNTAKFSPLRSPISKKITFGEPPKSPQAKKFQSIIPRATSNTPDVTEKIIPM